MWIVKAQGLTVERKGRVLFKNVDLSVGEGERVALIGRNGVGKTTLLRCLTGALSPDRGSVTRRVPVRRWGMLEQSPPVSERIQLLDYVRSGDAELHRLKTELSRLEQLLTVSDHRRMEEVLSRYTAVQEAYQSLDGYSWERETEAVLTRMEFAADEWNIPFTQLSGGQKTRAQLARLLAGRPSFLLLDEPTNHLDEKMLDELSEWLAGFKGACLFVSHDRDWIDRVADATVELTPQGSRRVHGGYTAFQQERERERREQAALYQKQEQERKKLEESIQRYHRWFNRAHNAAGERNPFYKKKANKHQSRLQAKEKALERLKREQVKRPTEPATIQVKWEEGSFEPRELLRVEGASFAYGDRTVLKRVDLTVWRGDRLAVIGPNGSGKSTLLKGLIGKIEPEKGCVRRHPALRVGYFAQELEELDPDETVLESLLRRPGIDQGKARNILASFLFRQEEVHRKIGQLSMGEKCRVAFVNLYFSGAHLMVLDEPTNYLDLATRERIEEALLHYPGTLILVSHDRRLIDRVSNKTLAMKKDHTSFFYPGSTVEYRRWLQERAEAPEDPEVDGQVRELELTLTRLMAEEAPEEEEERKALQSRIDRVQARLDKLKG
ncbi:ABC transporter [Melghirimyces thermohalophilus]|uniref:ABC transporter n=1 Tax=Melghirimyces thermohalophilus TaxID=1236220 RepID=A0A1G6LCX3_9BACL|nr:ABC-F type ribosomal protection protein [Melghirimyces thermohalophilus]SDC40635.1 ABC transporter [Melghirimyces thermohalophilus]